MQRTALLALFATTACTSPNTGSTTTSAPVPARGPIERGEIESAQRSWCAALIAISDASRADGDAVALAQRVLSTAYDYDRGPVLFKPTLTHGEQTFRMTKRGALAYFLGGDRQYPDDTGFARKHWVACEPAIVETVALSGDGALAMGNVTLTDGAGARVKVDKTFGYRRDDSGSLRIVLHHSSLPYAPPTGSLTSARSK